MKNFPPTIRWLPPLLWAGLILFLSSRPFLGAVEEPSSALYLLRKAAHIGEYFILAYLAARALVEEGRLSLPQAWVLGAVLVAFAAGDEYLQTFIPGRSGQASDVLIDTIGISVALFWWRASGRRRERREKNPISQSPKIL
ncbi:MAG TPA: hypothetical protein ENJ77_00520 [Candidatus Moranbacteria bacterium]|nr:hypothetical protein [Candidatus Moranbacteria bacterium]